MYCLGQFVYHYCGARPGVVVALTWTVIRGDDEFVIAATLVGCFSAVALFADRTTGWATYLSTGAVRSGVHTGHGATQIPFVERDDDAAPDLDAVGSGRGRRRLVGEGQAAHLVVAVQMGQRAALVASCDGHGFRTRFSHLKPLADASPVAVLGEQEEPFEGRVPVVAVDGDVEQVRAGPRRHRAKRDGGQREVATGAAARRFRHLRQRLNETGGRPVRVRHADAAARA